MQTVVLDVEGMKCGGCVSAVERTLLEQPGVQRADVNLVSRAAWLDLAESGDSQPVSVPWSFSRVLMGRLDPPV